MAMTLDPARPSPGAGKYPLDPGRFDEAFAPDGTPRPPYAGVLDALARHDLTVLRERVQIQPASLTERACSSRAIEDPDARVRQPEVAIRTE
jgi:hypothetical protein